MIMSSSRGHRISGHCWVSIRAPSSSRRTATPRTRSFAPAILHTLLLVLLIAMLPAEQTFGAHVANVQTEMIDPGTGFTVCRNVTWGRLFQCLGRCIGGNTAYYGRRRLNRRQDSLQELQVGETWPASRYNCPNERSCVRIASRSCNWLGVSAFYESNAFGKGTVDFACHGAIPGECTLYKDPFCTQSDTQTIGLLDLKESTPVTAGGIACPRNVTNDNPLKAFWKPDSWCQEAYDYLAKLKLPANCPNVTEKQILGPPWYGSWHCMRSCDDKGYYVNVRREKDDVVRCKGSDDGDCAWYTDSNCTSANLAPGEQSPWEWSGDSRLGLTCKSTTQHLSWCRLAEDLVLRNLSAPTWCPGDATNTTIVNSTLAGPWTCVTSCADQQHSLKVRKLALPDGRTRYMCQGNSNSSCSWYSDRQCTMIAPNEYPPGASGEDGVICSQNVKGWCRTAFEMFNGGGLPTCSVTATATSTPIAVATSRGEGGSFFTRLVFRRTCK